MYISICKHTGEAETIYKDLDDIRHLRLLHIVINNLCIRCTEQLH